MSDDGSCSDTAGTSRGISCVPEISLKDKIRGRDSFFMLNQEMENWAILQSARGYLALCSDFDKQVFERAKLNDIYHHLPADLREVEEGVNVLCSAYMQALKDLDTVTRVNIQEGLLSLSSFYENKTAEAYFSACTLVFDASDMADQPDVLKELVDCRDNLKELHLSWPIKEIRNNRSLFDREVDFYCNHISFNDRALPEKIQSFTTAMPFDFNVHTRGA